MEPPDRAMEQPDRAVEPPDRGMDTPPSKPSKVSPFPVLFGLQLLF